MHDASFRVRDSGLSAAELRRRSLAAPYWGVRTPEWSPTDPRERARAFLPRLPDRAFYVRETAAAIWGVPRLLRDDGLVHVGVRVGARRLDALGVAPHHLELRPEDITVLDGLPVTTPERTWCDLAAVLDVPELIAAGDRIVHRRAPLATLASIARTLARYEGRRGARRLRDAFGSISDRSDSVPESLLRVLIMRAGIPMPVVNAPVLDRSGRLVAHPDLSWPAAKVAVEYEGDHHRTDRGQWHYDVRRYDELTALGWLVIRVTAADLRDPTRILLRIADAVRVRTSAGEAR